jgi:hypothetical protein
VTDRYRWEFKGRFRRNAFGWRSQPANARLKQAVSEIGKVARRDPALGADGAVILLERLSPALEQVDSSSGAIGTAVNAAIHQLVPIIANAPADPTTRQDWLERLWAAHQADQIPYIERLADFWGELCGSRDVASAWADRLVSVTRLALSPDRKLRGYWRATSMRSLRPTVADRPAALGRMPASGRLLPAGNEAPTSWATPAAS